MDSSQENLNPQNKSNLFLEKVKLTELVDKINVGIALPFERIEERLFRIENLLLAIINDKKVSLNEEESKMKIEIEEIINSFKETIFQYKTYVKNGLIEDEQIDNYLNR